MCEGGESWKKMDGGFKSMYGILFFKLENGYIGIRYNILFFCMCEYFIIK